MTNTITQVSQQVKDLIHQIRSGCSQSREDLAVLLYPIVRNIVGKYYKNSDDKSSTTNYILGKIFHKMEYFDINKSVLSYIKLLANNHCIDEYRKKFRKKKVAYHDNDYLDSFESSNDESRLTKIDYLDLYNVVTNDIEKAEVIYSILIENKSIEDVALEFSLPKENIEDIKKVYIDNKLRILLKKQNIT